MGDVGGSGHEDDAFGEVFGDLGDDIACNTAGDIGSAGFAHDEGVAAIGDGVVEDFFGDALGGDIDGDEGDACFFGEHGGGA